MEILNLTWIRTFLFIKWVIRQRGNKTMLYFSNTLSWQDPSPSQRRCYAACQYASNSSEAALRDTGGGSASSLTYFSSPVLYTLQGFEEFKRNTTKVLEKNMESRSTALPFISYWCGASYLSDTCYLSQSFLFVNSCKLYYTKLMQDSLLSERKTIVPVKCLPPGGIHTTAAQCNTATQSSTPSYKTGAKSK